MNSEINLEELVRKLVKLPVEKWKQKENSTRKSYWGDNNSEDEWERELCVRNVYRRTKYELSFKGIKVSLVRDSCTNVNRCINEDNYLHNILTLYFKGKESVQYEGYHLKELFNNIHDRYETRKEKLVRKSAKIQEDTRKRKELERRKFLALNLRRLFNKL